MEYLKFFQFSFIFLHVIYLCFTTQLNAITMSNIGYENTRRPGIVLKVINNTGFVMCARYCEQYEMCGGFSYLKSKLLCELFNTASEATETSSGWRLVSNLSWLQENGLSKQLRSTSCTSHGRNYRLSSNVFHCENINYPIDCGDDNLLPPESVSGVYRIKPMRFMNPAVYCDLEANGAGWTVIQRRQDGSADFFRGWGDYREGFGIKYGEYWLGNDNLHKLTSAYQYSLRIDMEHFDGTTMYAEYSTFLVAGEDQKYKLTIGGYSGDAGDALYSHNNMQFSTYDNDNDVSLSNCAVNYKGGWWYTACHVSNLNGLYYNTADCDYGVGINWQSVGIHQYNISLKSVVMKIRHNGAR